VKRKTFYHISLSLPYLALAFAAAFTYFASGFDPFSAGDSPGILLGSVFIFSVAGIIWGPLYTWMVVAMLFWGRGKSADEIRRMYILSPVLLACSMGIPALFVGLPNSGIFLLWGFLRMNHMDSVMPFLFRYYYHEQSLTIGVAWAFMAALCIVIGYAFAGLVLLIESIMKKRGLFEEGDEAGGIPPAPSWEGQGK
jgi:hypothetical protein